MLLNRHGREVLLEEVPGLIAMQLVRPVRFGLVMFRCRELGITDFIEIEPGSVLRGLVWLNHRDINVSVCGVSDRKSFDTTLAALE